ncbi:hypothetical protein PR048_019005 [Dryococelus australis]|uniref:Uncharacterized protein n=1 Tax=Dryococelus australis TaxID=614101 RepID=A0ABQ9H2D6_9NEOP|nr:hypothetical protein PR048_019005 [Dryococelus australis]
MHLVEQTIYRQVSRTGAVITRLQFSNEGSQMSARQFTDATRRVEFSGTIYKALINYASFKGGAQTGNLEHMMVSVEQRRSERAGKRKIPEKTRRPAASSGLDYHIAKIRERPRTHVQTRTHPRGCPGEGSTCASRHEEGHLGSSISVLTHPVTCYGAGHRAPHTPAKWRRWPASCRDTVRQSATGNLLITGRRGRRGVGVPSHLPSGRRLRDKTRPLRLASDCVLYYVKWQRSERYEGNGRSQMLCPYIQGIQPAWVVKNFWLRILLESMSCPPPSSQSEKSELRTNRVRVTEAERLVFYLTQANSFILDHGGSESKFSCLSCGLFHAAEDSRRFNCNLESKAGVTILRQTKWRWGRGGLVVRLLASPQRRTGFDSRRGHTRIFACGKRVGRCRWSAGFFLVISRLHRSFIPALLHTHFSSPSSDLKTLRLRAAQISSLVPLTREMEWRLFRCGPTDLLIGWPRRWKVSLCLTCYCELRKVP